MFNTHTHTPFSLRVKHQVSIVHGPSSANKIMTLSNNMLLLGEEIHKDKLWQTFFKLLLFSKYELVSTGPVLYVMHTKKFKFVAALQADR